MNIPTSTKPIIAIDVDDVIAANAPAFVEYSNKKYGTRLTLDDYQEHWGEVWKVDHEELLRRSSEYTTSQLPTYAAIDGAYQALKQLKKRFKLVIVTSRRRSMDTLTRAWLQEKCPDIFDDIVFSGFFDTELESAINLTKGDIVKDLGAEYFIDDQLKHIETAAGNGITSLLFGDYSWNKTDKLPENTIRVKNWQEVVEYFAKLKV